MLSVGTSSPVNFTGEVHVSQRRPGYRYGVGLIAPPNPLKKINKLIEVARLVRGSDSILLVGHC